MYCSNCGKRLDDGVAFCTECGTKVAVLQDAPLPDTVPLTRPVVPATPTKGKKVSGGVKAVAVVGALVAVILVVAGVGLLSGWFGMAGSSSDADDPAAAAEGNVVEISVERIDSSAFPEVVLYVSMTDPQGGEYEPGIAEIVVHEYTDPDELYRAKGVTVSVPNKNAKGDERLIRLAYDSPRGPDADAARTVRVSLSPDSDYSGSAEADYTPEPSSPQPDDEGERRDESKDDSKDSGYIIPESNTRYLTEADLEGLSVEELFYARNEIFARYGRGFQNELLQKHFSEQPWYTQRYTPSEFDAMPSPLNDYERKNVDLIRQREEKLGSPYL